jgi:hypothetical protein
VYTHSTGLVEDKGQYIQAVTSGNQRYDSIDYEAPAFQTYGSTAVVATKVVFIVKEILPLTVYTDKCTVVK